MTLGVLLTIIILALSISTKAILGTVSCCRRRTTTDDGKRSDMKIAQQTKNIVISNDFECGTNCLKVMLLAALGSGVPPDVFSYIACIDLLDAP